MTFCGLDSYLRLTPLRHRIAAPYLIPGAIPACESHTGCASAACRAAKADLFLGRLIKTRAQLEIYFAVAARRSAMDSSVTIQVGRLVGDVYR